MATQYTSLLGLALPVTGELSGTWGDTVNDSITSLLDTAVAGTTTLSTDTDVTLTTTTGASNQARQAIILWAPASGTTTRNITAPAQSKIYTVINASGGTQSIVFRGAGPTTGVTIVKGEAAIVAWNGSDFIKVSNTSGAGTFTNLTVTGNTTLGDASGDTITINGTTTFANVNPTLSAGTANQVQFLNGSKVLSGSAGLTWDGTTLVASNLTDSSLTSGRVTFATTAGNLTDSANLTFNGTDLTVSGAVNAGTINATTLDLTNIEVTNIKAKDGTASITLADSTGVASFSANPVLSGGTANGVAYLNGSKVLTTGSALTFDGTNLGVGAATPSAKLDLGGTVSSTEQIRFSMGGNVAWIGSVGSGTANGLGNLTFWTRDGSSAVVRYQIDGTGNSIWSVAGSEQMRLTSTGLGIGTSSPSGKLDVTGSSGTVRVETGGDALTFTKNGANYISAKGGSSGTLVFETGGATERMRLDNVGNLGLGVTPSAWTTTAGIEAFQISSRAALWGDNTQAILSNNMYASSTGDRYIETGFASLYTQISGQHRWLTAPSGTAGDAITFTQAMTLDASGNLGVGTTSPTAKIDAQGAVLARSSQATHATSGAYLEWNKTFGDGATWLMNQKGGGSGGIVFGEVDTANNITERARIDSSGNFGIGTSSPGYKLDVQGTGNTVINLQTNTSGSPKINLVAAGSDSSSIYFDRATSRLMVDISSVTGALQLNASGNLGLGVTPSAWSSSYKAFEMPNGVAIMAYSATSLPAVTYYTNAYYDGTAEKYKVSGYEATSYGQSSGQHRWYTAPSGTAGNAISFTQAMTLDASGNLMLGTTTQQGRLHVSVNGVAARFTRTNNTDQFIEVTGGDGSGVSSINANYTLALQTGGTERARIDSSGNLLINVTSQFAGADCKIQAKNGSISQAVAFLWNATTSGDANFVAFGTESSVTQRGSITYNRAGGLTAYNTTSDYRAKDIIGPVVDSGALIDSVPVYMGKMKGATQERPMFIAHETPAYAHTGEKDAVDADGNPVYQQMDASALIPVMWAEIQSLRARVAALESNP